MSKLTELARGQECMMRYPGVCNFNVETTIPAHLNLIGISGRGKKAPDQLVAHICSACHDAADGRIHKDKNGNWLDSIDVKIAFYEAIFRTQYKLISQGHLK